MSAGFLFDSNAGETAESLAKKRKVIEALLAKGGGSGGSRAPQDIGDGIYAIGQAIGERRQMAELAAAEKKLGAEGDSIFGKVERLMGGGGGGEAGPVAAGPVADMAPAGGASVPAFAQGGASFGGPEDISRAASAIRTIESGSPEGDYGAMGPATKTGDRGHGAFQVMGANIGPWTEKHLGVRMSPQEFLSSREAQDKVFQGEFGGYMQKYGPGGAAQAWFGGPGSVGRNERQDVLGTSVGGYGSKFLKLYGGQPQAPLPPPPRSWEIQQGQQPDNTQTIIDQNKNFQNRPDGSKVATWVKDGVTYRQTKPAGAGGDWTPPERVGANPADLPAVGSAPTQGVLPPPVEPPIQMAQAPGTADQMAVPGQQVAALAPPMPISPQAGPMQPPPMPEDPSSLGPAQASPSLPQMAALNGGGLAPPGTLPAPAAVQPLPPGREVSAAPAAPIQQVAAALAQQQAPQPQMPMDGRPEGQINVAQALMDAQARGQGAPQGPGMAQASPTVASVAQALGLAPSPGGASPQAAMAGPAGQGAAPAQGGNLIRELARYSVHPALKPEQRAVVNAYLQRELARQDKREEWGRSDRIRGEDRQIVVGDRTLTQNREDVRRTEDQTRADRDRPLDLRTKTATAEKAERELLTGGPLPEARRTWESIKADNDKQGKPTKSFEDWLPEYKRAGAQNINVGGGSDKQIFDAFEKSADDARTAATGLTGLREARAALKAGMITGAGAEARLALQKAAAFFGLADTKAIVNSETFVAAIAPQVASILKATVGNANISNTDREFAEKAGAGKISLDEGSITRLMDIMERASLSRLNLHKNKLDKVYPEKDGKFERERALFGVDLPAESAAAPPPSGAPVRVQSPADAKKLPSGTKIILPDGSEGRVP